MGALSRLHFRSHRVVLLIRLRNVKLVCKLNKWLLCCQYKTCLQFLISKQKRGSICPTPAPSSDTRHRNQKNNTVSSLNFWHWPKDSFGSRRNVICQFGWGHFGCRGRWSLCGVRERLLLLFGQLDQLKFIKRKLTLKSECGEVRVRQGYGIIN